ncbi:MAG: LLM class flavin-dependent oxidoreductase [Burkholderiales bacterium]|nr:LLM class flavin-dependent oxidoreductase [Burkholderiales bacterium]
MRRTSGRRASPDAAIRAAPPRHALPLAEEVATLDLLSGGRLEMGFGRGYPHYDRARR